MSTNEKMTHILIPLNIEGLKLKAKDDRKQLSGHVPNPIKRARKILKILERDNFECIKCTNKNELTIDHINGREFAKWDNHQKYKLSECQTLCINCHNKKNECSYSYKEVKKRMIEKDKTIIMIVCTLLTVVGVALFGGLYTGQLHF